MRALMYFYSTAAKDEDVQKRGIVCVLLNMGPKTSGLLLDGTAILKIPRLLRVLPLRANAVHLCSDRSGKSSSTPANFGKLFPLFWKSMGPRIQVRLRYYSGMYNVILGISTSFRNVLADDFLLFITIGGFVEIFYKLKCIGIPTDALPLDIMGELHLEYHAKWYQKRQAIEMALHGNTRRQEHIPQLQFTPFSESGKVNETKRMSEVYVSDLSDTNEQGGVSPSEEASGSIVEKKVDPLPYDYEPHGNTVLCGRGKMCKEASGNLRLQLICKTFLKDYGRDTGGRKEKSEIVSKIMEMVRASCAPSEGFVRFHNDRWWEVEEVIVRQKVTGVLRDSLASKYKSSTQAKVAKRRMQNVLMQSVASQKDQVQILP